MKKTLLATCVILASSLCASAQTTATMFGALANFDVLNDQGKETYGFEIEIHGINSSDIGGTFSWNRYGSPQIVPFTGGVYVRYMAKWDAARQLFNTATPIAVNMTPTMGHQCVMGTLNYDTSGCEHFGVWTYINPTSTIYRWLLADLNNPGQLVPAGTPVAIPAPTWTVQPPAQPGGAPIVAADVDAPIPPAPAEQYGDAQWMKVYKTENQRQVGLDELVADNVVVPQDAAQIETNWYLVQAKTGGNGKRQQKRNQGSLGNGNQAVVRRFEFYKFSGTYDPVTHEAICADGLCNVPADTEVGDFIGAQNAAANLVLPASVTLTVVTAGNGQVSGSPGSIKCPGACTATVAPGTAFTLTANPSSGNVFTGWSGACVGTQPTCTVTLDSSASVSATFVPAFTLSVGRSGKGVITSNPAGISCGTKSGNCSLKFGQGTVVTLTAVPDPGSIWTGWTGACTGTDPTCSVIITKDTSVQANFR
jgi:uncharacterized repeat protein (TIGR02543 family)